MSDQPLLRMEHISKAFPGVQALDDVTLEVAKGEIHALVGENGAGKTTLMNILTGALLPDQGSILLHGRPVRIETPADAQALGISIIHQELALISALNVGQNIFLGREPAGALPGTVNWRRLYQEAARELHQLGLRLDPTTPLTALSIAEQQMVEIAKALSLKADLLVMDEPTSALTERETETLFRVMRSLREQGVSIIFITHRLEEVFEVADRVTVLRDGRWVATKPIQEVRPDDVVRMMVGRQLGEMYPKVDTTVGDVVLRVEGLSQAGVLHDITFELRRGEIVGVAGLVGAGRTELARALFGIDPIDRGRIWIDGQPVTIDSPQTAIRLGMGLVPEDRKAQGLFLDMAVRFNITISQLPQLSHMGVLDFGHMDEIAQTYVERLDIRTPGLMQRVRNLSGGNQQKVVIARWLTLEPKILILDEPTRGIDVGAKAEIHALMGQLAQEGVGLLMISSELPEILGVSDRILVMHEGRITAELPRAEATQDAIMRAATGG
ncbi:MAG: sugar ABC transporter ATP-binding protein [Chloroflexi bacterium]|nr:sugar ABC transporter ATP-binding protein [Chloroflexota bacterium]